MDSSDKYVADWVGLPKHLLDMVLEKLDTVSDFVRFGAVCSSWYCVAMENRELYARKFDVEVPMLLMPKDYDKKGEVKTLYSVTRKEFIDLEVRVPTSTRYGGSSRGWLITVDEDFVVTLINPVSPGATIRLPPLRKHETHHFIQIRKAILSADPIVEPNNYTVAAIYGDKGYIALIRPGRQADEWTYIDHIPTVFDDIIYYQGRLHAIDFQSKVFSFVEDFVHRELSPRPENLWILVLCKNYLVESLEGNLLVHRLINFHLVNLDDDAYDGIRDRSTVNFEVYKLDPSGPVWVKTESLGNQSLFLGDNMSMSLPTSKYSRCYPNSIYFTHDFDILHVFGDRGPRDCGVFCLENSRFSKHFDTDEASFVAMTEQPPIWLKPNFFKR